MKKKYIHGCHCPEKVQLFLTWYWKWGPEKNYLKTDKSPEQVQKKF